MSNIPADLKYTAEHEWVKDLGDGVIRFGITDFAQDSLGDIVFATLPALGATLSAGTPCGEIESTKSVSDIYAPVSGEVIARNDAVETAPETLNSAPYGEGWIADVKVSDTGALATLLSADQYADHIKS